MSKPKDFVIGGEVFSVYPLSVEEDLEIVMEMTNPAKAGSALKKLIMKTIRKSVPDATEEEIKGMGLKYFKSWKEAIEDVNGLGGEVDESSGKDKPTEGSPKE